MIVYFSSSSGFTHKFVRRLGLPAVRIPLKSSEAEFFSVSEPYILIVPTYGAGGKGFVPKQVIKFLRNEKNRLLCRAVVGSGNTNFGVDYCEGGRRVASKIGAPLIHTFELSGLPEDVDIVKERYTEIVKTN